MSDDFFDTPAKKPSAKAASSNAEGQPEPIKNPTTPTEKPDFMSMWDTDTEYREARPEADTNPDTEPDGTDTEQEDFAIDDEAAEFAADLAVNANQEGMSRLLRWMHGEGELSDYRANNESLLKKAWHRFFTALNIKISKEKGILFANVLAFGMSFTIGIWKLIGRIVSGAFRWPWKKKKVNVDVEETATTATVATVAPVEKDAFPDPTLKQCPQSKISFAPGTGYPKNKNNKHYDQYATRSAYQSMLNYARTEEKKSDTKEKDNE